MTYPRTLGLDIGTKTIGVAVSDILYFSAHGVTTIRRSEMEKDIQAVLDLCEELEVTRIVVGYPKNMNNTIGESALRSEEFANILRERTGFEVILWDERLTTVEAERLLLMNDTSRKKRRQVIDKIAAELILQGYMDSQTRSF